MQDPRLRLATTLLLSGAAFASVPGAALVFIWWLLCTNRIKSLPKTKPGIILVITIGIVGLFTTLTGGDGLSYVLRMGVIVLIASWALSEYQDGDGIDIAVWALGTKTGFDLGLTGELAILSVGRIKNEYTTARTALFMKKGNRTIPFREHIRLLSMLFIREFDTCPLQAAVLARRGYSGGAMVCPTFCNRPTDRIATITALFVFLGMLAIS